MKKILFIIILFYFLVVLESSFFPRFHGFFFMPNFILLFVMVFNLLEKAESFGGIFAGLWGGFCWDVFSNSFLGFHILMLTILAILIKLFITRYVRIPYFNPVRKL